MTKRFEFATATRVLFGAGTVREIGPLAKGMGKRALVVTGRTPERAESLLAELSGQGIGRVTFGIVGEPTTEGVMRGAELARREECDFVVGLGGGSVVDAAKAVAALMRNPGELMDYLEVIGKGRALPEPPAPCIAIPTTAGTGAEVTRNAVLASREHLVKVSLRSPLMLPTLAVVDPELTYGLPPAITASTGLDALTQLIEPYVSARANPLTDGFCVEGMRRVARSLRRAYERGNDVSAREDMALASLLGGLALANAGLGAVHGFAAPLGGRFSAPHGAVCAILLPEAMEVNLRVLREREASSVAISRYEEVARLLTGHPAAGAEEGVEWVRELCRGLQIPGLSSYGMKASDLNELAEQGAAASSMKGNPIQLRVEERVEILRRAL